MPRLWLSGRSSDIWSVPRLDMASLALLSTSVGSSSRSEGGVSHLQETSIVGKEAFVIAAVHIKHRSAWRPWVSTTHGKLAQSLRGRVCVWEMATHSAFQAARPHSLYL